MNNPSRLMQADPLYQPLYWKSGISTVAMVRLNPCKKTRPAGCCFPSDRSFSAPYSSSWTFLGPRSSRYSISRDIQQVSYLELTDSPSVLFVQSLLPYSPSHKQTNKISTSIDTTYALLDLAITRRHRISPKPDPTKTTFMCVLWVVAYTYLLC